MRSTRAPAEDFDSRNRPAPVNWWQSRAGSHQQAVLKAQPGPVDTTDQTALGLIVNYRPPLDQTASRGGMTLHRNQFWWDKEWNQ